MRWTSGIVLGRLGDSMRSLSSGLSYHLSAIAFERGDARDSSAVFFPPQATGRSSCHVTMTLSLRALLATAASV